ncbi:MAG: hypothetical protein KC501_30990 [Myxococcales bacterium]|nr:hypothetical protein [Myxococcales bacterium]
MINGALPRPVTNPEGVPLRALAQATDDVLAQRVFTKAVDYSGVAHLSVDPSLSAGECRVPASMLVELFKPRAFGILEERGYVATIKSAKRSIEEERPEGLAAIEEASEGFPGLLMAGSAVVCRRLRRWDAPAIAVDPSTAERLGAREVALHVPVMHEAALQVTRLPDLPGAPSHASAGWLVHAGHTGALVRAAFEAAIAGERDGLDDPVVALALGRVPIDPDARELERWVEWDRDRRAGVRAWVVAREGELGPPDASTSPHLDRSLDELELSVRTSVALHSAGLSTVRELCRMTEADLLRTKNLGRRSLKEIEEILLEMGLSLRMTDV